MSFIKNLLFHAGVLSACLGCLTATGLGASLGYPLSLETFLENRKPGITLERNLNGMSFGGTVQRPPAEKRSAAGDTFELFYRTSVSRSGMIGFSYGRKPIDVDRYGHEEAPLSASYFGAQASYRWNSLVLFSADFQKGSVADGNTYHHEGLETRMTFLAAPVSLYSLIRIERKMYDRSSSRYYSPSDSKIFSGLMGLRQETGIKGFPFGVNGLGYELNLKVSGSSDGGIAVIPQAGLAFHCGKGTALKCSYEKTYCKTAVSDDIRLSFTLTP